MSYKTYYRILVACLILLALSAAVRIIAIIMGARV